MRIRLEEQLQQLNLEMIKMGVLCEDAINNSIDILFDAGSDAEKKKRKYKEVRRADSEIDHKERELEVLCMKILLRQQPVASDLRIVSSVLKMISDFERIGDQASDIAELAQYIIKSDLPEKIKIKDMASETATMVTDCIDAFVNKDLEGCRNIYKPVSYTHLDVYKRQGLFIVVSHDRHFLNTVCTNIVDVDYGKITMYVGNYEFWYQSSQLMQKMVKDQNKRKEDKIKELQSFIQRFSANKSKSKQATARRKLLDKLSVEEMPASSRRYPYVGFTMDREAGKELLTVENLSKTIDGVKILNNISFRVNKDDKIAFVGENELANTTLFKIITGEMEPDEGTYKWGTTTSQSYFPLDNNAFFDGCDLNLVQWLSQYTEETTETFMRSFLGRMLFSGDDVYKPVKVL